MGNAMLFTALLLGAAVLGGFVGSCCAKRRQDDEEAVQIKDRLEYLEGRTQNMDERLYDCEMLIGETPDDGLLNRVAKLEEAERTHEQDAVIVNGWVDEINALKKELDGIQTVNDEEHRVLRDVLLALNKHGHGCVVGLEAELSRKKEAKGGC